MSVRRPAPPPVARLALHDVLAAGLAHNEPAHTDGVLGLNKGLDKLLFRSTKEQNGYGDMVWVVKCLNYPDLFLKQRGFFCEGFYLGTRDSCAFQVLTGNMVSSLTLDQSHAQVERCFQTFQKIPGMVNARIEVTKDMGDAVKWTMHSIQDATGLDMFNRAYDGCGM